MRPLNGRICALRGSTYFRGIAALYVRLFAGATGVLSLGEEAGIKVGDQGVDRADAELLSPAEQAAGNELAQGLAEGGLLHAGLRVEGFPAGPGLPALVGVLADDPQQLRRVAADLSEQVAVDQLALPGEELERRAVLLRGRRLLRFRIDVFQRG